MPQPWEQYQRQGGDTDEGPWTKYKKQTPSTTAKEQKAETPGLHNLPGDIAGAVGKFGKDVVTAIPRGVAKGITSIGSALPGAELPFLPQRSVEAHRQATEEARQYGEGGDPTVGTAVGRFGGEMLPFVLSEGMSGFGAATPYLTGAARSELGGILGMGVKSKLQKLIPGAVGRFTGRTAQGALEGGEAGAAYSDDPNKARAFGQGAALGAATPLAGKALEGVGWATSKIPRIAHMGHFPGMWAASHFLGPWGLGVYPLGYLAARATRPLGRLVGSPAGASGAGIAGSHASGDLSDDNQDQQSRPGER